MRPRVAISAGRTLFDSFFSPSHQKRLSRICAWERDAARTNTPGLRRRLAHAHALITTWDSPDFDRTLLQIAPELRMIAHCGGEVKKRFAAPLFDELTVTNAPGPMARSTAELGAALLLYCARDIDHYRDEVRRSNQIYSEVHLHGGVKHLFGREVSMIGFGRIGRALVDLMRGFDLRWIVYDPFAPRSLAKSYPVTFMRLDPLLRRTDLLVLTAALTEQTRGLLNRTTLALLRDGAAIINIARGGLVDLPALTREVRSKRLRCALDVTDPIEPLPLNHPIRRLPGAILTPHIAGSSRDVRLEIATTVMDDLENFFGGKPVKNRVTRAMLERMT